MCYTAHDVPDGRTDTLMMLTRAWTCILAKDRRRRLCRSFHSEKEHSVSISCWKEQRKIDSRE
jgi:hypothetical protein